MTNDEFENSQSELSLRTYFGAGGPGNEYC
jgi:hypothetical protein